MYNLTTKDMPCTPQYIVASQAHPALVKIGLVLARLFHFNSLLVHIRTKGLTDHVWSWHGGLAVLWRPRPSGTRQYIGLIWLFQMAENQGFSFDELELALKQDTNADPVSWLKEDFMELVGIIISMAPHKAEQESHGEVSKFFAVDLAVHSIQDGHQL